jgi:hypothetical protein
MKRALVGIVVFGLLSIVIINCNGKSNPTGPSGNNQNSGLIDSVKVKVIVNDTAQIGIDHRWQILINKPELVDEIIEIDSGEGNIVTIENTNKSVILDTTILTGSYSYEDIVRTTIKWVVGNQSRDTEVTICVMDTIPVDVQAGSFAPQTLTVGDSLYLYVKTNPFTNVPYTCQWHKDCQKIGDTISTQGSTTVPYSKGNIMMTDSGAYSISIYRAHSSATYAGMQVHVIAKQ